MAIASLIAGEWLIAIDWIDCTGIDIEALRKRRECVSWQFFKKATIPAKVLYHVSFP